VGYCPECGAEYEPAVVACPKCRVILVAERPAREGSPEVIHRVPDAAAGALLEGMLQHHGIRAVLRSTALPGYGLVRRDWSTSAWGEILVNPEDAAEARALIADYLLALERGGEVRDEDVDEGGDGEGDPGGG
jgi:DNA-directed RNA polymerase subunit RPC12/RpoP